MPCRNRRLALLALLGGATGCGSGSPLAPTDAVPAPQRVVMISIDGMMPATYLEPDAHGLRVPRLRQFAREGALASGARSSFPSVTYPAHTTIATGQPPARHKITTNRTFDPRALNEGGWRWYAEDIASPTLWDRARAAGLSTAIINWPVTVGARADFNVPEYWRAGTADDVKLARALCHPRDLLLEVAAAYPRFESLFTPPDIRDEAGADIVRHLILEHQPTLIMTHMWWVDEMQHRHGVWSPEAIAALETADAQIDRLVRAAESAGVLPRTVFVIVSDHGFAAIRREVSPGAILANAGLIDVDEAGAITSWRASAAPNGGLALIHLAPDAGPEVRSRVTALFRERAASGATSGIGRVYSPAEIAAHGGDPSAALALEAAPGFGFTRGVTGPEIIEAKSAATHGFDPERPDMKASLLIWGGSIEPRALGDVALVDVAPTVAGLLGLPPIESAGSDLLEGR